MVAADSLGLRVLLVLFMDWFEITETMLLWA